MKTFSVFLISVLVGFGSVSTAFAFPQSVVNSDKTGVNANAATDTKKDYEKFNAEMNKELKDIDAQIKALDKEANKTELTNLTKKRNTIDKDLYDLKDKKDPYYTELKYDIEQEHKMLRNDIDKISEPQRLPASK